METNPYAAPTVIEPVERERKGYRIAPLDIERMPPGIPFIVGNEAAERFSYYGMRAILVIFMTQYLLDRSGELSTMTDEGAKAYFHTFMSAAYLFPVLGAIISDGWLGKYRTIMSLSIVYCLGHLALALDETRLGLAVGLSLIALGSGGIKPCVSAHVGDQFGPRNQHLLERVFGWFYFSINFGSFFSTLLTPKLLEWYGPRVAFAVPGVLMLLATIVFWLGRRKYAHIPAGGLQAVREALSPEGRRALAGLALFYVFIAPFWALYDQTSSAWILQAGKMDLNVFGIRLNAGQTHSINPLLILLFIPLFSYVIYPAINRVFPLTPLRKVGIGFVLTALSFLVIAGIEHYIQLGYSPSIHWQFLAYVIITAAEVMVSITGLEYSYTQAPKGMKSIVMATFFLSVSLGNQITAVVNSLIGGGGMFTLSGPAYYLFFSGLMMATTVLYVPFAMRYREARFVPEAEKVD